MDKDRRNKKTEKKNKPILSAPVISREGRIARTQVDDPALNRDKKRTKAVAKDDRKTTALVSRGGVSEEVTISDNEFWSGNAKKAKNKRGVHTLNSKVKNPFPVVTVLACVVCTFLFMSLVFNLVRINEYTKDVSDMRSEVNELTRQKSELGAALEKKNNGEELAKYLAEHESLSGMVKEDTMNPAVPVTPDKSEVVKDYEAEEESDAIITTVLNALAKNLTDVLSLFGGE